MSAATNPIRIYVACLAAYNNGHLHGRWIEATQGKTHISEQTRAMLEASPIEDAEEWAIHDYEGFEGVEIGEYASLQSVAEKAEFINERGAFGGKVLADCAGCVTEATEKLEKYIGLYDGLADYAREHISQTLAEIPPSLEHYIDYPAMGRDMEINGEIVTLDADKFQVHIFWGA